jgi:hypothetical protein
MSREKSDIIAFELRMSKGCSDNQGAMCSKFKSTLDVSQYLKLLLMYPQIIKFKLHNLSLEVSMPQRINILLVFEQ